MTVMLNTLQRFYLDGYINRNDRKRGGMKFLRDCRRLTHALSLRFLRKLSAEEVERLDVEEPTAPYEVPDAVFDFLYAEVAKLDTDAPEMPQVGISADVWVPLWDQLMELHAQRNRAKADGAASEARA